MRTIADVRADQIWAGMPRLLYVTPFPRGSVPPPGARPFAGADSGPHIGLPICAIGVMPEQGRSA